MKISVVSIGKFENSAYQNIFQNYVKRIKWKVDLKELDIKNSKNLTIEQIKSREATLILQHIKPSSHLIALDEKGQQFSSREFANLISNANLQAISDFTFVIGGSEGLSKEILSQAKIIISFGRITLPHLMARIVLAEQIYRIYTIINKHPYHRD
jgi:23S rRNA (pseudouridine1915-N3)-methyltransferase